MKINPINNNSFGMYFNDHTINSIKRGRNPQVRDQWDKYFNKIDEVGDSSTKLIIDYIDGDEFLAMDNYSLCRAPYTNSHFSSYFPYLIPISSGELCNPENFQKTLPDSELEYFEYKNLFSYVSKIGRKNFIKLLHTSPLEPKTELKLLKAYNLQNPEKQIVNVLCLSDIKSLGSNRINFINDIYANEREDIVLDGDNKTIEHDGMKLHTYLKDEISRYNWDLDNIYKNKVILNSIQDVTSTIGDYNTKFDLVEDMDNNVYIEVDNAKLPGADKTGNANCTWPRAYYLVGKKPHIDLSLYDIKNLDEIITPINLKNAEISMFITYLLDNTNTSFKNSVSKKVKLANQSELDKNSKIIISEIANKLVKNGN